MFGASVASAAGFGDATGYGNVGFGVVEGRQITIETVTARLGARFGSYVGVEGEVSVGINKDRFIYSPPCAVPVCPLFAILSPAGISNAEAVYAVGYFPVWKNADLFARVGYGVTNISSVVQGSAVQSVNIGAGAQYFVDDSNGLRIEFTRATFNNNSVVGKEALGSGASVWSLAYTRRF